MSHYNTFENNESKKLLKLFSSEQLKIYNDAISNYKPTNDKDWEGLSYKVIRSSLEIKSIFEQRLLMKDKDLINKNLPSARYIAKILQKDASKYYHEQNPSTFIDYFRSAIIICFFVFVVVSCVTQETSYRSEPCYHKC